MRQSLRRRWPVIAGVALVILVVAELATRVLAPYLPEPLLYGDEATQVKVEQMDRIGPSCTDVVVAGNSMGRDAFDPELFTSNDPQHRSAYNASLDAASPELLRRWMNDQVLPRLHPSTVVLTVASLDFNANGNATRSAIAAYDDAELTHPGVLGRLQARAIDSSSLVRYRRSLRDPSTVWDALTRARDGAPATRLSADGIAGVLGSLGQGVSRRPLHYQGDPGTKAFTRDQLLGGYSLDPTQIDATRALVTDLQNQGVKVELVVLPVTADYIALHPNGQRDFDTFLTAVRGIAGDTHAPFVDLHEQGDRTAFADTHHLNETGADSFSTGLPKQLADAGISSARRCA